MAELLQTIRVSHPLLGISKLTIVSLLTIYLLPYKIHANESMKWFTPHQKPTSVTIVIHGLNQKPEKMDDLVHLALQEESQVLRLTLHGHGPEKNKFLEVTRSQWLKDVATAYSLAKAQSEKDHLPLYFIGYSLGALLLSDFAVTALPQRLSLQKSTLFAPALTPHWYTRLVQIFKIFGPHFFVTSWGVHGYMAHRGTSMAAYEALFQSVDSLQKAAFVPINWPTLVFIDPKDELVSYKRLRRFISEKNLSQWTLTPVTTSQSQLKGSYHHLITDAQALGQDEWTRVSQSIQKFIFR